MASHRSSVQKFRQSLYLSVFGGIAVLMDLLDALSSNTTADSVVELSLNPQFRWGHRSLYGGIEQLVEGTSPQQIYKKRLQIEQEYLRVVQPHLPQPQRRSFMLLASDVTPLSRPFAVTLADRSVVYAPLMRS